MECLLRGINNVTTASIPRDRKFFMLRSAAPRVVSFTLVTVAMVAGLVIVPTSAEPAQAATTSALTVSWNADTSDARQFQPDRLPSSPHYNDFKDIKITVSQTTAILDQAIRVSVEGFAGTVSSYQQETRADNAMNYLQAMQCWGPDPLADDFNETCQWGGRYLVERNGLGDSVISDNAARTGPLDFDSARPTTHDVPFRTIGGTEYSGKRITVNGNEKYPILDLFGPSTTNEVVSARVGSDGTGYFDFETQSSDQAPHLGCGTAAALRCWLVVVPRGSHFGGNGVECSGILDPRNNYDPYTYGKANAIQGGSPVNDQCDYWDNRIVVPLDFTPTGNTCPVGSSEFRVTGSQLMIGAMSSWQPSLCQTIGTTFSFATNPDSVARTNVLETGASSAGVAYTGFPVSSGELPTDDQRTLLAKTKLVYAPVAISSVVIGFIAESASGRQESLNLSPRLMAKILTQSYPFLVPQSTSSTAQNATQLGEVNRRYTYIYLDPEFQALNPTNYLQFTTPPAVVLPGPSGADAIRQLWRWIFADADAVAFLNGTPDGFTTPDGKPGMTVNPYYLPKGNPAAVVPWYLDDVRQPLATPTTRQVGLTNLDGTPQKLTEQVLDTFPKNDETLMPIQLSYSTQSRFDSIQFAPYVEDLLSAARQGFRADPNSRTIWDPNRPNSIGTSGDWVTSGAQVPGQKFMIVITDSVSAIRYGLNTAAVRVPNSTVAQLPDEEGMANALAGLAATSLDTVKQIDPSKVPTSGYPMTMVTYAAVNLSKSTPASRTTIADLLKQITTSGQVRGAAIGQLPVGYLPLTAELTTSSTAVVNEVRTYTPPKTTTTTTATNGIAQDTFEFGSELPTESSTTGADPTETTGVDELASGVTEASSSEPIARNALVIALVIGLAGFLVAPILFRGGLR